MVVVLYPVYDSRVWTPENIVGDILSLLTFLVVFFEVDFETLGDNGDRKWLFNLVVEFLADLLLQIAVDEVARAEHDLDALEDQAQLD